MLQKKDYASLVRKALAEDLGKNGDVTSKAIFSRKDTGVFTLLAKDTGILCGKDVFIEVFRALNKSITVEFYANDGERISKGSVIARVSGCLSDILTGERSALNFISHLSGIATKANRFAQASGGKPVVLDTRKTIPGLRMLQKYAVLTGGGANHRIGLYDMVLIKDNHIDAAGSIASAVGKIRKHWGSRFKIEVETRTLDEVQQALEVKADRIMLDNMNNDLMTQAVRLIAGRAETEASGNMTLERLPSVSSTGVDFVSFGELTHTVTVFDFSLKQKSSVLEKKK